MGKPRASALTLHGEFQVPLEGTALTLGMVGVGAATVAAYLLEGIGLTSHPIGPIRPGTFFQELEPGGFLFTCWKWPAPRLHWAAILLVELSLWSVVGVAISRIVITRVRRGEPLGLVRALRFAVVRVGRSVGFVALVTALVLSLSLPLLLPAVLSQLPGETGDVIGTLAFVVSGPFIFLFALLAVAGLLAGFPVGYLFMPAALAAEEGSFLDCVTRAVGYAFARPFLFIWDAFKMGVFAYCLWYVGIKVLPWAVNGLPTMFGLLPDALHPRNLTWLGIAEAAHTLIILVTRLVTGGFVVAYVFGAGTLIYLNLRQEVDGIAFTGPTPEDPEPGAAADNP